MSFLLSNSILTPSGALTNAMRVVGLKSVGGRLKAMAPKLASEDGRHIVIRPLAYVPERDIARYARGRGFPIIPCNLCGSQENMQRVAVKKMLAEWEREFPGRTESIFSAIRNVETAALADPEHFDFGGVKASGVPAADGDIAFDADPALERAAKAIDTAATIRVEAIAIRRAVEG